MEDLCRSMQYDTSNMPDDWCMLFTDDGRVYFSNSKTLKTTWLDPRTGTPANGKTSEDLPPHWEEKESRQGVVYYVDHKEGITTWRHPLTQELTDSLFKSGKIIPVAEEDGNHRKESIEAITMLEVENTRVLHSLNSNAPVVDERQSPAMTGWMSKQGGTGIRTNWRRRWFVLKDYCLYYYKNPKETEALGKIPLPSYQVSPIAPSDRVGGRKHVFKVQHGGMRTYWFQADTHESMVSWMNALSLSAIFQDARMSFERRLVQSLDSEVVKSEEKQKVPESEEVPSRLVGRKSSINTGDLASEEALKGADDNTSDSSSNLRISVSSHVIESRFEEDDGTRTREDLLDELATVKAKVESLKEERDWYKKITITTKTNLSELKRSMFEPFEILQKELYDEQEKNATLTLRIDELTKELGKHGPAVSMVDNLVKLGNAVADENENMILQLERAAELLRNASERARSGPSQKLLHFSRQLRLENTNQSQLELLCQFLDSGLASLEVRLGDLEEAEMEAISASERLMALTQERVALESELGSEKVEGAHKAVMIEELDHVKEELEKQQNAVDVSRLRNNELEEEVLSLRRRLKAAEDIKTHVSSEVHDDDARKATENSLLDLRKDFATKKLEMKSLIADIDTLRLQLCGGADYEKISGSPTSSSENAADILTELDDNLSTRTRLELELELRLLQQNIAEQHRDYESLFTLRKKLSDTLNERGSTDNLPDWVREVPKQPSRCGVKRMSSRHPEKLSFEEKLAIFL